MPVSARNYLHLVAFEHACHGKDVSHIVIDDQHLLAGENRIRIMESLQNLAFVFGQPRSLAMEPERGLIEKALRTAHVLNDRRLRDAIEFLLLLRGEVFGGINDDRQMRVLVANLVDQLETRHVGQQ